MNDAIQKAIDHCGGVTKLAKRLGVSTQFIFQMRNSGRPIPASRAVDIDKATEGAVSRHELRPDLWDSPP